MPQMSPMMWMFLLFLMFFLYLSIVSFLSGHSCIFTHTSKLPNKKNPMEW